MINFEKININEIMYKDKSIVQVSYGKLPIWYLGSIVTYIIDEETQYKIVVKIGDDCLHPYIDIPEKEDYVFLGWSTEIGSTTPLDELIADGNPITLYACWKKERVIIINKKVSFSSSSTSINPNYTIDCTGFDYVDIECTVQVTRGYNNTSGYLYPTISTRVADSKHQTLFNTYGIKSGGDTTVRNTTKTVTINISDLSGNKNISMVKSASGYSGGLDGSATFVKATLHN